MKPTPINYRHILMETKQTVETLDENWIANDPGYLLRWRFCFFKALINITKTGQLSGTDDVKWCRNCTHFLPPKFREGKIQLSYLPNTHGRKKENAVHEKEWSWSYTLLSTILISGLIRSCDSSVKMNTLG